MLTKDLNSDPRKFRAVYQILLQNISNERTKPVSTPTGRSPDENSTSDENITCLVNCLSKRQNVRITRDAWPR